MAEWAWQKDQDPNDDFHLNKGSNGIRDYQGPSDPRLLSLCKELWMRTSYGGRLNCTIKDQVRDPETFGPGWTREEADRFLKFLYRKFPKIRMYLKACRRIARLAYAKNPYAGVVLTDPSDGAVVRWNPVARADVKVGKKGRKLTLSLPGKFRTVREDGKIAKKFEEYHANDEGDYPVHPGELERLVAPCLIQMLDAYYSTLVMELLAKRGVTDFVGIHDCWLVPENVYLDDASHSGDDVLRSVMSEATSEWFAGLGPIYDGLLQYLPSGQKYSYLIRTAKKKWEKRVKEGSPPVFLAKSS